MSGRRQEASLTSYDVFTNDQSQADTPRNSLMMILSGLYGLLLVVLGLVLPIAEIFTDPNKPYSFELFYIYLYGVSMVFLLYVYTYLLRKEKVSILSVKRSISRKISRSLSFRSNTNQAGAQGSKKRSASDNAGKEGAQPPRTLPSSGSVTLLRERSTKPLLRQNSGLSTMSGRGRRKKIAYDAEASHHTGSFYLRIGVIGFGIGSMIHSSLTFGYYFEINQSEKKCSDILQAIKPFTHLLFTFVQMYFVFMNSKMCVHKYKSLARFGLMHMSGTNICVWLRSIVVETLHVIKVERRKTYFDKLVKSERDAKITGSLPELNCKPDALMGQIVEKSSVYLYPCTIEYSLVCACVLYVMWSNVGGGTAPTKTRPILESNSDISVDETEEDENDQSDEEDFRRSNRMSVDCAGSSQGLFLGILLFVIAVVCLVCFYVLIGTEKHLTTGTLLGHISEDFYYLVALIATLVAAVQMRSMHYSTRMQAGIEEILTLISLSGLVLFGMFSIVASVFYLHTLNGVMTILTNLCMILQAGAQATFTLTALRASAADGAQVRQKPGRQFVTFLLVSNFALWVINTFETQRLEHNPLQVEFYGPTAWSIFTHISVPLGIYFRFHSTVSLSNVWKKAWKRKHMTRI
ncbi:otopetrin-2 [Plakobranchus ocellatus]|uniref:Otopetrin-2 n=1 Tax=Plakobranchus ocellatus TaxID=259542 RepID=A0AAV4ATT1_9GAST|nr:otopetrin-2 [Plakobranchus ocellatus]